MKILMVEYFISMQNAVSIMKKLNMKKHVGAGYFFELTEIEAKILHGIGNKLFKQYPADTQLFKFKVWREIEGK